MAFIDTSDTWLATRRQRLVVALAGPYATIVFAGLLGLVARAFEPPLSAALWISALASYISVFQNLNPLIELDGYYTLVHLLDRPNLRMKSLGWLATSGWDAMKHPSHIRGHGFDAMYAVASVLYIIGAATLLVVVYRTVVQGWVAELVPESVAVVVGWLLAALYVLVTVAAVTADLRRARRSARVCTDAS
jgi:putative peptide zinc metalloprotease protein